MLAEYDAAKAGEKAACCAEKGCTPPTWWSGAGPGTPAARTLAARLRTAGRSPEQAENDRLRGENERLHGELAKTQAALDLVGKAHALLELLSESADTEKRSKR
jgi:transposase